MNLEAVAKRSIRKRNIKRVLLGLGCVLLLAACVGAWQLSQYATSIPLQLGLKPSDPSPNALWPWKAEPQVLGPGVRAWSVVSGDGTLLRLMRFDFGANPRLKFSIWDNEAHDDKSGDNLVKYWPSGVAQITKRLNQAWEQDEKASMWADADAGMRRGKAHSRQVLAASNGAFFGYANKVPGPAGIAFHVGPVVLDGKIFFNGANHRWTFGTRKIEGRQVFGVVHLPDRAALSRFEWAAGSVQCLVKDGEPLKLEPFPRSRSDFKKQPVPSTPAEAGHIPVFDHMKTCRVSLAWSRDSKVLWWLVVKEPDIEAGSAIALKQGLPVAGGWTVPDVQRFWLSLRQSQGDHVWCAINSDAGDVAQMIWKSGSAYEMIPPRWADKRMKMKLKSDFSNAPLGGPMMAFVVSG